MSYHVVDPGELDPLEGRSATARSVSEAADLENVGIRVYEADPGEQIPLAYHYHDVQEEAFYVVSGTLHVETPDGEFVVERDQFFLVDPGFPHRAYNPGDADRTVRVVAVGAPATDDVHEFDP
ncbi:cupin domain-containing protein [Halobacteriales archaeon QS_8_69_26]|nr:MAG: cupin domain-containing protein [Halobacteriales archaeon QS_8_69_26]